MGLAKISLSSGLNSSGLNSEIILYYLVPNFGLPEIILLYFQKVLACRRELVDYDRQQRQVVAATSSPVTSPRDPPLMKAVEVLSCASKKDKSA